MNASTWIWKIIAVSAVTAGAVAPANAAVVFNSRTSELITTGCDADCSLNGGNVSTYTDGTTTFDPFVKTLNLTNDRNDPNAFVIGQATQNSIFSTTEDLQTDISVDTVALSESPWQGDSRSLFSLSFTLTSPMVYLLMGNSSNRNDGGWTTMSLQGPGVSLTKEYLSTTDSQDAYGIEAAGMLAAGQYTLLVEAIANGPGTGPIGGAGSSASVWMRMTPVPLPAGLSLLFSGLVSLAGLKRRRQRSTSSTSSAESV